MRCVFCSIWLLVVATLMGAGPADAASPAAEKPPYDKLAGVWSEDCSGGKQKIVITPEYHAIVDNLRDTGSAIGLGKIKRLEVNGEEITFVFSAAFLHQVGDSRPRYRLSAKNEIIAIRDAEIWKQSDRIYREDPSSRPEGYVSLNEHEYGMRYHRCDGGMPPISRRRCAGSSRPIRSGWNRRVIAGGTQDELVQWCNSNAAELQNILTLKKSG